MNKTDHQIEDLARLAREGCVYRGSSQQADRPLPTQRHAHRGRSLRKLTSLFKNGDNRE